VAAGFFPLAFGTQTGGSIIRPAAFCGIVGFKPSFGAIHRGGMKVMSESHDTIGVMARSVADCALSMGAMTGRDYGKPEEKLSRAPRLAFTLGPPAAKAAPETLALMERAIAACRKAGAEVVEITLPEVMTEAFDAHEYVTNMESVQSLGWELEAARAQLSDVIKEKLDWAKRFPTAQLDACKLVQAKARAALPGALEGFDAVITASAAGEAPAGIGWTGDAAFNSLWTLLHGPCVTVPAGTGPQGLPLGVQIAGRIGEDAKVLAIGEWLRGAL
jgi:Asp-tRNA(Asn)/Glu-tRNA(Gln) amidotransferase A subunit family amidase